MTNKFALSAAALAERADEFLKEYRSHIAQVAPEAGFGGIWESEMFIFYTTVRLFAPGQVLESGRGRGKSTEILARCLPETRIISVELNFRAPNAIAAEAKLKNFSNLKLLYGDSRRILPQHLQTGDAVLIDGPKGFRALKLALKILSTGKPCVVFVHDCPPLSPAREFLLRHYPGVFFGDDPLFERFQILDQGRDPFERSRPRGYGVFACLPAAPRARLWWLRVKLLLAEFAAKGGSRE